MADDVRKEALQLLRLLNEQQAKGLTDLPVIPDEQMAADAGLEYRGSDLYGAAIQWLLDEGALRVDPATKEQDLIEIPGAPTRSTAFNITLHGLHLLRETR